MGYIRSNEEWYLSQGMSYKEALIQCEMDRLGRNNIDYGFCNPRKIKLADEQEEEIRKQAERNVENG
jgi:hypothetical protein